MQTCIYSDFFKMKVFASFLKSPLKATFTCFSCTLFPNVVRENTAMEVAVNNFSITWYSYQNKQRNGGRTEPSIFLCFILDKANHVAVMLSCEGVTNLMFWLFEHCEDEAL